MSDTFSPLHTWGSAVPQVLGIVLHGRGAHPVPLLELVASAASPEAVQLIAPTAPGYVWYPERFIMPQYANEPALSTVLSALDVLIREHCTRLELTRAELVLFGFSQGACLVSEYLKRYPARYRGAVVCSGGLIGTDEEAAHAMVESLHGTPVYLGCDAIDHHIPWARVAATAQVLSHAGANVDVCRYEGMGHTVHHEALAWLREAFQAPKSVVE